MEPVQIFPVGVSTVMVALDMKRCRTCGVEKARIDFPVVNRYRGQHCQECVGHPPQQQVCLACGKEKKITEFRFSGGYYRKECAGCDRTKSREYNRRDWLNNKQEYNARALRYYHKNKDRIITRRKAAYDPKRAKELRYIRHYNLTIEDMQRMLLLQGNKCRICDLDFSDTNKLQVDHNHETGAVRGLLCGPCNMAIGLLKDNINSMKHAIEYLDEAEKTTEKKEEG